MSWTPNRIVALGTGVLGIAGAAVAVAAELTGPQAAGLIAGAAVVLGIAREWLVGWQKWEARQGEADQPVSWDDAEEILGRLHPDAVKALTERLRAAPPRP